MKKVLFACIIFIFLATFAYAAPVTKTFQWEQNTVDTAKPDFGGWRLYYSTTSGGPYTKISDINFVSQQSSYEEEITLNKPEWEGTIQTLYFVCTAFNKVNNLESGNSNEVTGDFDFSNAFSSPFNFKIVIIP